MKKQYLISTLTLILLITAGWSVALQAQPGNDSPCNATPMVINGGLLTGQTNVGATADADEQQIAPTINDCTTSWCETNIDNSVWYTFIATSNTAQVSTCGMADFDSQIAIYYYSQCADYPAYTLMGANDDSSLPCATGYDSYLEVNNLTPGTRFYILVDGYGGDAGSFDIELTGPPTIAPYYDNVCSAAALEADGTIQTGFYNTAATTETSENTIAPTVADCATSWCELNVDNSVWFYFYATSTSAEISLCDETNFDSQIALYESNNCGDFSTFTLLKANDDSYCGVTSSMTVEDLQVGNYYYLMVDGYYGVAGTFGISITPSTVSSAQEITEPAGEFSIAPNPSDGPVRVELEDFELDQQLSVTDLHGRTVYVQQEVAAHTDVINLDLGYLPTGMYALQLRSERGVRTQRVIIQQ